MSFGGDLFLRLQTAKSGLLKCLKIPFSEHLCADNMLKGPNQCLNYDGSIFGIFFEPPVINSARAILR